MPTNLRIIRVMCSGSLDPSLIFEALIQGADGLIVMGCHPGDCHYISGNLHAERKVNLAKKLLDLTDLENERFRLEWVSAAEGQRFAEVVEDFTEQITALGPSPLKAGDEKSQILVGQLTSARNAVSGFRLRSVVSRINQLVSEGNVYGQKLEEEELERLIDEMINEEYLRHQILYILEKGPTTIEAISDNIGVSPEDVFKHVGRLWKRQIVLIEGHEGDSPLFIKAGGN